MNRALTWSLGACCFQIPTLLPDGWPRNAALAVGVVVFLAVWATLLRADWRRCGRWGDR